MSELESFIESQKRKLEQERSAVSPSPRNTQVNVSGIILMMCFHDIFISTVSQVLLEEVGLSMNFEVGGRCSEVFQCRIIHVVKYKLLTICILGW